MDPSTDTFLVNAAIAGLVSGPWIFRATLLKIAGGARSALRREYSRPSSCPLLDAEDDELRS